MKYALLAAVLLIGCGEPLDTSVTTECRLDGIPFTIGFRTDCTTTQTNLNLVRLTMNQVGLISSQREWIETFANMPVEIRATETLNSDDGSGRAIMGSYTHQRSGTYESGFMILGCSQKGMMHEFLHRWEAKKNQVNYTDEGHGNWVGNGFWKLANEFQDVHEDGCHGVENE